MSVITEAREYYRKSIGKDARGSIWNVDSQNFKNLLTLIENCNDPGQLVDLLHEKDMYNITIRSDEKFDLMMDWHRSLPFCASAPRWVDTPNLMKMHYYVRELAVEGIFPTTIVELGGGNGQFSYVANRACRSKTHIDIDIPESLYMAYVCTRYRFPEAKCLWVTDEEDVNVRDYDFVFIPVGKEKILHGKNFDLFVNTASMGEMANQNIRYWMDFVQNKINVKYFFGLNRFLNTIPENPNAHISKVRSNENEASVLFDEGWDVLRWEVEPMITRCPYDDTRIARYLLIILKRADVNGDPYYKHLKKQDWFADRGCDPIMTYRDNQLVHDLTISGTLFKLWNALRFFKDDVDLYLMMLEYLRHLSDKETIFEESIYYKRKLDELVEAGSKDFSVIIPTRYNFEGLKKCLDEFENLTARKDMLEVILVIDDDDPQVGEYFDLASGKYTFEIRVFQVQQSDSFQRDYCNFGAYRSSGKNIMVFNDDAYMLTPCWDDIIRRKTAGKEVYMLDLFDSTHDDEGKSFPKFPMVSKKAHDAVGFFCYPQVRMWPADQVMYALYNSQNLVIKCHEVKIQHDHVYAMDTSKTRMWRIMREDVAAGVFPVQTTREAIRLKKAVLFYEVNNA